MKLLFFIGLGASTILPIQGSVKGAHTTSFVQKERDLARDWEEFFKNAEERLQLKMPLADFTTQEKIDRARHFIRYGYLQDQSSMNLYGLGAWVGLLFGAAILSRK